MRRIMRVPLKLTPQPDGVYTVTSPLLPELITEGATVEQAVANAEDALAAVLETYADLGWELPEGLVRIEEDTPLQLELVKLA
jgi:antitoxin HicB